MMFIQISPIQLYSKLNVSDQPTTIIMGPDSGVHFPEGVAFSPSGDCVAVANTSENSISFYKRIGESGATYETSPSCTIKNKNQLLYVHDVTFTPSGKYIGAVSRNKHQIVMYQRDLKKSCSFYPAPVLVISGEDSKLNNPDCISFSSQNVMGIANRMGEHGINFYKLLEHHEYSYDSIPYQQITEEDMLAFGLAAPHNIEFTPDGTIMASVHKKYKKNKEASGESGLAIYEKKDNPSQEYYTSPSFVLLLGDSKIHACSFHCSGKYLAIADQHAYVQIYEKNNESIEFTLMLTTTQDKKEGYGRAKGIAFSLDGNALAISYDTDRVYIYDVHEVE